MASAICTSYKREVLAGTHTSAHAYKLALVTSLSGLSAASTTYTGIANEVANGNGYATGGAALSGFTTGSDGTTAWVDFTSDPSWAAATITAVGGLIYNDTLAGKNAVMVLDFGGTKTSTNGTFAITFPTADATNALIRLG
jgi:hypothetical protein